MLLEKWKIIDDNEIVIEAIKIGEEIIKIMKWKK